MNFLPNAGCVIRSGHTYPIPHWNKRKFNACCNWLVGIGSVGRILLVCHHRRWAFRIGILWEDFRVDSDSINRCAFLLASSGSDIPVRISGKGCSMMDYYKAGMKLMCEIYVNFSEDDRVWFQNENPAAMHLTLGMHLRNHCGMWETKWVPELIDGIDHSPNHPDAISQRVIKDFQTKVNLNKIYG